MQKSQLLFMVSLIFAIIVTVFALTNSEAVVIHLFFYDIVASQALVIFISAASGAMIVIMLGLVRYIKTTGDHKTPGKERSIQSDTIPVVKATHKMSHNQETADINKADN